MSLPLGDCHNFDHSLGAHEVRNADGGFHEPANAHNMGFAWDRDQRLGIE
jgi:hypothetical protein